MTVPSTIKIFLIIYLLTSCKSRLIRNVSRCLSRLEKPLLLKQVNTCPESNQVYHCLLDDLGLLKETCNDPIQIPSGKYPRYSTFSDRVYYVTCPSHRYQPWPVMSFEITECELIKSTCSSLGQVVCNNGSATENTQCGCDNKRGYVPADPSSCCSPSVSTDCYCILRPCKTDKKELNKDYNWATKCEVDRNIPSLNRNTVYTEDSKDPKQISTSFYYDTLVPENIILIVVVLYLLKIIFICGYGLNTTWRPFRFKLIPYVILSTTTMACLAWLLAAMHIYDDTKMVVKVVMTIFTALMFGAVVLYVYISGTRENCEEFIVYNDQYDKRMHKYLNAAATGDLPEISRLKHEGYIEMVDVNYDHRSALHLAACENQVEVVKYILSHQFCFPSATDRWNRTALADVEFHKKNRLKNDCDYEKVINMIKDHKCHGKEQKYLKENKALQLIKAAEKGNIEKLKSLLKRGTDMNLENSSGHTALHAAAANGILDTVTFLLEDCKVSPFVRSRGLRPLDIVPYEDSPENNEIRELLNNKMKDLRENEDEDEEQKEKIDCSDPDLTIVRLLNSASRGDIRQMRILKNSGCDMNGKDYDKRTALHMAVSNNQEYIVDFLLEEVCNQKSIATTCKDRWNRTPFEASKQRDSEAVYSVILKHCPDLFDSENDEYYTYLLLNAAKDGNVDDLKSLFKKKIDMNLRNYSGRTALHIAAAENNVDAVKFLVKEAKVAVSIPDNDNHIPKDETTNDEIRTIIEKGKDNPKQTTELTFAEITFTMVMKAAAKGLLRNLKDDIRYKHFKMDSSDHLKETPLHVSATKGRLNDVRYLVNELKVSPFVRNSLGKMPIDLVNEKIKMWQEKEENNKEIRKKSRKNVYKKVKHELETAMENAKVEEPVVEDEKFKHYTNQVQIFVFLNKAYKGDIRAIRSYLKTDQKLCNAVDYDSRSALHIAVAEDHQHLVDFLKNNGADLTIKDRWGNKPEQDQKPQSS